MIACDYFPPAPPPSLSSSPLPSSSSSPPLSSPSSSPSLPSSSPSPSPSPSSSPYPDVIRLQIWVPEDVCIFFFIFLKFCFHLIYSLCIFSTFL